MTPTPPTDGLANTRLGLTRRAYRRALIGSTALVGITVVAVPVAMVTLISARPANALDWDATPGNGAIDGGTGTWDNNTTANWTNDGGATNVPFVSPNQATFGATAGTVTIDATAGGAVSTTGIVFNTTGYTIAGNTVGDTLGLSGTGPTAIQVAATTATISAVIANGTNNALEKTGVGILVLSGVNTYTGLTTITAGTLALSGAGSLAASSGVQNNSAFDISAVTAPGTSLTSYGGSGTTALGANNLNITNGTGTVDGVISGAGGSITLSGGTLTLTAVNTYTGPTTISGGATLTVNTSAALGDGSGTNTLVFNGGTLQAAGTITSPAARGVTLTGAGTINTNGNAVSIAGVITGAGALTKSGTGTLTLTGTNTNSGTVTISGGILNANASAALGDGSATNTLIFNGGTLQAAGTITSPTTRGVTLTGAGTVDTNGQAVSIAGVITGTGAFTKTGTGTLTLTGTNTNSGTVTIAGGTLNANASAALGDGSATNTLIFNGGTLQAAGTITSPTTRGVTLTGAGTVDTNGQAVSIAGVITGAGAFTKAGAGTLTLSGANTYSGGTALAAGTIQVQTSSTALGTGALTFTTGTTLQAGTSGLNLANAVTTAGTSNVDTQANALTLSGIVSGAGTLTKVGSGALSLSGANTYSGGTALTAGTIQVQTSNTALGTGALTFTTGTTLQAGSAGLSLANAVTTAGTSNVDTQANTLTLSGIVSGAGTLTKVGSGTLTLSGANTYTGGTALTAGTIQVQTSNTALGTAALTFTDGTTLQAGTSGLTLANAVTTAGTSNVDTQANTLTLSGIVSGGGAVAKQGTGTLILTAADTYTGATTISAGTLQLGAGGTTGSIASTANIVDNAALVFNRSNALTVAQVISGTGTVAQSGGAASVTTLTGANTYTGATSVTAGTLQIGAAGATGQIGFDGTTYSNVAVSAGANLTVNRTNAYAYGGVISGAGAFTQAGTGTTTLTGANTYTGATAITAGTLQIGDGTAGGNGGQLGFDGTTYTNVTTTGGTLVFSRTNAYAYGGLILGSGTVNQTGTGVTTLTGSNTAGNVFTGTVNVTAGTLAINGTLGNPGVNNATLNVATAGTLHGSGTFAGNVNVNAGGTVSAGNSPGTLTVAGNYTVNAGSTNLFEFGNSGVVGGANNDLIVVGGNLAINGGTLQLRAADSSDTLVTGSYRLYNYAGTGTFAAANAARGGFDTVTSGPGSTATVYTNIANQVNVLLQNGNQLAQYWDGADQAGNGTVDGGTAVWNATNTNWTTLPGAQVNDIWRSQVGIFAGTAGTVTVNGAQNVQGLQFTTSGYTINGPGTINLTGDPFTTPAQSFLNIDTGVTVTVNAAITGNAGIGMRKIGGGTLQLGGASTYPGATTVDAGTLTVLAGGSIVGTSSLTNSATFALNAGGTVTTPTVANNATFTTAGTLNATTSLTNNAGGTFNLTGGTTTTPTATNAGTFNQTGGTFAANNFINASGGTFTQTGGALNSATVTNDGTYTASGGNTATTSFTNNGTLAVTSSIATPTFTNTATVNGTLQLTGNTTATNTAAGTINNGINITAAAGGATFANAGIAGTGGLVVGNTGGTLVANNTGTFNGFVASAAGTTSTFNNTSTWNYQGTSTLAGLDTINTSSLFRVTANGGTLNGLETFNNTGSGRVELLGDLGGPITTFNNNANGNNGGVYLQGRSINNVTTFNNNAFLSSVTPGGGTNNTIGAATFNNNAAGTISLVNGVTTDRLTLGGNYNGTAGSRIAVDVNLSQNAGMRSDLVTINGANNGTTTLVVNRVDNRAVFFSTPIQVITASGGASNVQLSQPIQGNGVVTFDLVQNSPGSYQIVSRLNVAAAAGAAGSITSLITALNVGFFQSVSAFIGAPSANKDDQTASTSTGNSEMTWAQLNEKSAQNSTVSATPGIRPNTISGGIFARGSGGQFAISANNTATFPGATTVARTKVETTFGGYQFGGDTGLFNIDNTGWNLHLGVTGGEAMATGTQKFGSVTTGNFTVPFVGVYSALTNGPFFSDLSYRHDFYDAKITDALAGVSQQRISLQSNTVAASAGYRFDFPNLFGTENPYFIEPSGSISFTHTNVGNFAVNGGNLRFSDIDSILPRAGVRVGTAFLATDQVALQPFVTLSVLHEFGESVRTRFEANTLATDPNAFVPILTQRVGTFGQVGVGAAAQILDTPILGYVRGDVRFGDRIDGYALNAGVRYQF